MEGCLIRTDSRTTDKSVVSLKGEKKAKGGAVEKEEPRVSFIGIRTQYFTAPPNYTY